MERSPTGASRPSDGTASRAECLFGLAAGLVGSLTAILLAPVAVRQPEGQNIVYLGALLFSAIGAASSAKRHARQSDGASLWPLVCATATATIAALWSALSPPLVLVAATAVVAMLIGVLRGFGRARA